LDNRIGWWRPYPVEYKRGRPKADDRDAVQLCAQATSLEEMLKVPIECGFLYYGQTKHREHIIFNHELRTRVEELSRKMHKLVSEGKTPKAQKGKHCSLCSLIEHCQPNLTMRHRSVEEYLKRMLDWEGTNS
jgi:CRISPR-associated exonuclease Cas4